MIKANISIDHGNINVTMHMKQTFPIERANDIALITKNLLSKFMGMRTSDVSGSSVEDHVNRQLQLIAFLMALGLKCNTAQ